MPFLSKNIKIKNVDVIFILIILFIITILCLYFFVFKKKNDVNQIKSIEDAKHSTIAVLTGSNAENVAHELFPEATIQTYNLNSDALYAVDMGNAKYGMALEFAIKDYNLNSGENRLEFVGEPLDEKFTGIFFARNEINKKVLPLFNEYINRIKSDGTLAEIDNRWFNHDNEILLFDFDKLDNSNGTLIYAIDATYPPYTYIYNNQVVGFDVEVVYKFCEEYHYGLDVRPIDYSGMLTGIKSGKFDIGGGGNAITEERKKSVDFSEPLRKNKMCLFAKFSKLDNDNINFIQKIKDSFRKTFIHEDRYKLFIDGLKSTIFMSFFSILLGTILSFVICLLRLTNSNLINKFCDIYVSILEGVPILVILLLFYYIIFNSTSLKGEYIAILAFSLNFSAYVSETMITAIKAVDIGQWEAAYALGFGYWTTFIKFIFKQSLIQIIPVYKGEVISLIKSTSIVGYIAVQDLTKMSDIVRSRTFEPFIPILSVALVYYIFSFLVALVLNKVLLKYNWINKNNN